MHGTRGGHRGQRRFPWFGLIMVAGGTWWLLAETVGIPFEWHWFGPIAVILVGLGMLLGRHGHGDACWSCGRPWPEKDPAQTTLPASEPR